MNPDAVQSAGAVHWLEARWPLADRIRVLTTLRQGGVSTGAYEGFNLATHVGDDPRSVAGNRQQLQTLLGGMPVQWLDQVHGTDIIEAKPETTPEADGAWTDQRGVVLAILTADCLPVVLADAAGTALAAVHGGWRGLVGGVLEAAVASLPSTPTHAWLGPAIGPDHYEVGPDVLDGVRDLGYPEEGLIAAALEPGKGYLDLFTLAERKLRELGVASIHGERWSTWDTARFYSYRREGQTGRMATLAWLPPLRQS